MLQFASGQETDMDNKTVDLTTLSQVNQGNSYVTILGGLGNIDPLWFEANLVPNFYIRKSNNSRLMAVLTPQIILRMYQEESFPVRTPSYIPQLTVYYSLGKRPLLSHLNFYGRVAHHSNGQEGESFYENGDINHLTGNFSTNYLEFGFIKTNYNPRFKAMQFYSSSIEYHPAGFPAAELEGLFSTLRWHSSFSVFKLNRKSDVTTKSKASFSIKGKTSVLFGEVSNWKALDKKRLEMSLTLSYYPTGLEDIGLFVSIFRGRDYYNIYFDKQLSLISFGFVTEILRFNN
jgi:hypothetical protein